MGNKSWPGFKNIRLRKRLLIPAPLLILTAIGVTYLFIQGINQKIALQDALHIATVLSKQLVITQAADAEQIAEQGSAITPPLTDFDGHVPVSTAHSLGWSYDTYRYRVLSKWNLAPQQGLNDDFERRAWDELERQDQDNPKNAIAWSPIWHIDLVHGTRTLRYLSAIPALNSECVECHNAREDVRQATQIGVATDKKTWHLHQLMGAFDIEIPLNGYVSAASMQTRWIFLWVLSIIFVVLVFTVWFMFSDSGRNKKILKLLKFIAHDPLTGLYNNVGFRHYLNRIIQETKQQQGEHVLLYLHLNSVKVVTEACSSDASDQLIKKIADLIAKRLNSNSVIARIRGVEFAALMPNFPKREAKSLAESLLRDIKEFSFSWDNRHFKITASVGLAAVNMSVHDADIVLKLAEQTCFAFGKAKASARDVPR